VAQPGGLEGGVKMKNRIISISLAVMLALSVGLISCGNEEVPEITEYNLTLSSTEGGSVTTPGVEISTYDEGEVVELVAEADEGYHFVNWTGDVSTVANVNSASTTITIQGNYEITANFEAIPPGKYSLTISSSTGGSVTSPGPGTFTYDEGTIANLVATPTSGYQFINWTGDIDTVANISAASTTIAMNGYYTITANFGIGIYDWHDLDAIRENLGGTYILMNDLDSTTAGYTELASPTANGGKGWEPIGRVVPYPTTGLIMELVDPFAGHFDGQGCGISDLFVYRADEDGVGLFGSVDEGSVVENLAVVTTAVTGRSHVGCMVGFNGGSVSESHSAGSASGTSNVGGLMGSNGQLFAVGGAVSNSYSTGSVTGSLWIGGLAGSNWGTMSDCYSSASVSSHSNVGGLIGDNRGSVSNCYYSGSVNGSQFVGGLVGTTQASLLNSYYNCDDVLINGKKVITIGALFAEDFDRWLADGKFLDVNERLSQQNGYYLIDDVNDFKQLLAFGQNGALKFRLTTDLDLGNELNFYIPYLAGEFDGNGHKISNLTFDFDFVSQVGLFGWLAPGGKVSGVGVENANIMGAECVGGVVGLSRGTVSDSYANGTVTGRYRQAGGLVGSNFGGAVSNSYATTSVTCHESAGGLVGDSDGTVSNSYYNYDEALINGQKVITIGALLDKDFDEWLANSKFLDINERLSQQNGYYLIDDVNDFKQLLAFGQNGALKFRLQNDLDLAHEPNFYIPYLAGDFDGNGHRVSNLSFGYDFVSNVGLFGYLAHGGKVSEVGVGNANIMGDSCVGGVVGFNDGTVSGSYSTGIVTGATFGIFVGGLLGVNRGSVSRCYSTSSATGGGYVGGLAGRMYNGTVADSYATGRATGRSCVGGLVGHVWGGTVSNSYSTSGVSGDVYVGGLVGENEGTVTKSFWDMQTSGQATSAGGMGKITTEMKNIITFSGAGWNITAVANPGTRNPSYVWNIADGQTYPFLSWQL
jgi:hypothetical protein